MGIANEENAHSECVRTIIVLYPNRLNLGSLKKIEILRMLEYFYICVNQPHFFQIPDARRQNMNLEVKRKDNIMKCEVRKRLLFGGCDTDCFVIVKVDGSNRSKSILKQLNLMNFKI